jgi:hypothetical protein
MDVEWSAAVPAFGCIERNHEKTTENLGAKIRNRSARKKKKSWIIGFPATIFL